MKTFVCFFRRLSARSGGAAETEGAAVGPRAEKRSPKRGGTCCTRGRGLSPERRETGCGGKDCALECRRETGGGRKPVGERCGAACGGRELLRAAGGLENGGKEPAEAARLPKASLHSAALAGPAERRMAARIGSMLEGVPAGTVVEQLVRMGIVDCRRLRILCIRDFVHAASDGGMRRTAAMRLAARRFGASESFVSKCMYRYKDINL